VFGLIIFSAAVFFTAVFSSSALSAETPNNSKASATEESATLPEPLDPAGVEPIVAALSDEQVRRLLIEELKRRSELDAQKTTKPEYEGIAGFVNRARDLVTRFQERIEFLRAGGTAQPEEIAGVFSFLGQGEHAGRSVFSVIFSVSLVFAAAFGVQWLFWLYTAATRRRIAAIPAAGWTAKVGALSLRALLDLIGIAVFAAATLILFYFFLDRTMGQRLLTAAYLAAFVIVQTAYLVLRFFLAPHVPPLRFLPLSDEAARYLHRWIMALTSVAVFGLITCGIYRLAGASEADHFTAMMLVNISLFIMLVAMVLYKRKAVAALLLRDLPENSLRARLAARWHHYAIAAFVMLLVFASLNRLLGLEPGRGVLTLLMVPLYFFLDWLLRQGLEAAFGIAAKPDVPTQSIPAENAQAAADRSTRAEAETTQPAAGRSADKPEKAPVESPSEADKTILGKLDYSHMKRVIRSGLRIALAALLVFGIFRIWGVHLPVGTAVARAAFEILIVVLICYVVWEVLNAAIQRRLRRELPGDDEEEKEEGGAGGSRIATLLVLLRKFMLAVLVVMAVLIALSAVGVNIGPLIAGAGVVGLAIGFGSQTLVKDIIAGVFFLIDDAFRVGDYVECSGTKGMVEQISLRSLRLRHPRGMVNVIPFGDISTVTNYSRDYIITKLDFRVRYDADVEKIRKLIKKKVYKKIMDNPELAPKLLGKIKSQGVREMDDSAMIMRVKFKTIPGEQFVIRKEVYRLMQEAFRREGIEFAHRNVTVYLPPDVQKALEHADDDIRQKVVESGAAAGAAAIRQEEEKKAAEKPTAGN
jgi:small-conductance mechanosensitive channel